MRLVVLSLVAILFLSACGLESSPNNIASETLSVQSSQSDVAWNERVGFGEKITRVTLKSVSGQVLSTQSYSSTTPLVVDLPQAPERSYANIPSSITASAYAQSPSQSEQEAYAVRGNVEITTTKTVHVLSPYGSVVSGELNVIAGINAKKASCDALFSFLDGAAPSFSFFNDKAVVSHNGNWVCFRTADIGTQDTAAAKLSLEASLATYPNTYYTQEVSDNRFEVERNTVSNLDGSSAYGFDPSCDDLENIIDPAAQQGNFGLISDLRSQVSAAYSGQGVEVRVLGGDISDANAGACSNGFSGHEYNVASIINEIAPSAALSNAVVCNAAGACAASDIVPALLDLYNDAVQTGDLFVANMSLGSPLPDADIKAALRLLKYPKNPVNVVVSAGNDPFAAAHYPASYAKGVATSGLSNLISVGAVGIGNTGDVEIAGFNTHKNSSFMAFGVNVCTSKVGKRCDPRGSYPENLGLNGTSFSAPVTTAVAALFIDARNDVPRDLHRCLSRSLSIDKDTGVSYVSFSAYFAQRWACKA